MHIIAAVGGKDYHADINTSQSQMPYFDPKPHQLKYFYFSFDRNILKQASSG